MTDCKNCDSKLSQIGTRVVKKRDIQKLQRSYQGRVEHKCFGFNLGQKRKVPDGSMKIEHCKSCGHTVVWRKDGQRFDYGDGQRTSDTWRLVEAGMNIDVKGYLRRYGFK